MSKTAKLLLDYASKPKGKRSPEKYKRIPYRLYTERDLEELESQDMLHLRQKWMAIMPNHSPPKWNKTFFIPRLAYRMQEIAHNTALPEGVRDSLRRIASSPKPDNVAVQKMGKRSRRTFQPGQVVVIRYEGKKDFFTTIANGYLYANRYYKHLGNVVRAITGKSIDIREILDDQK